jgi:UDP-N-acetylmuramate dehydrogenase
MSLNIEFVKNESVKNLSSIKTSGKVGGVFYPKDEKELISIFNYLKVNNIQFEIIGNGSDILFSKKATKKLFICTKKMRKSIKKYGKYISFSSSMQLCEIYFCCLKNGYSGFEKLGTIPGTLGGAIKMNAGCFGDNIFDNLVSVKILQNGKIKNIKKSQIEKEYRKTNVNSLILSAKFLLSKKDKCEITNTFATYLKLRNEKQPKGFSLGSIFKNPQNDFAGRLIEECGIKGMTSGDAEISQKHANIIINKNNASFSDIKKLIDTAQKKVKEKFGIDLELEIKIY